MTKKEHVKEKKTSINYWYYLFLVSLCLLPTLYNFFFLPGAQKGFFLFYAFGQIVLEFSLVFCLISFFKTRIKSLFYCFVVISFLIWLVHTIDFVLIRILDLTFWEGLELALDESWSNFIEMLYASGLPLYVWIILFLACCLIPVVAIFLYKITDALSQKKPIYLKKEYFLQFLSCLPVSLIFWDYMVSPSISIDTYTIYEKLLPWKTTFFSHKQKILCLDHPFRHSNIKNTQDLPALIGKNENFSLKKKPNIYLFIVESLREDFLTKETAPNLQKFKQENISFDLALSNANATHLSWYSIFHANFPYSWTECKKCSQDGSLALRILKNAGYRLHLISSAQLNYYGMTEVIFGKNTNLLDSFSLFEHCHPTPAWEADKKALDCLENLVKKEGGKEGNVFILFLDSTHFDYSWPKSLTKFMPVVENLTLSSYPSLRDLTLIKNRYRNAIFYVDSLFSKFVETLKKENLFEESMIVFLADHGEEFFEEGNLFHASHLSSMQTQIPLYYKLGKNEKKVPKAITMTSHMDIFPSIFDVLFEKSDLSSFFDGESIFSQRKWPYVLTARYNASRTPYEFFIHNGRQKLLFRLKNKKQIYKNQEITVLSMQQRWKDQEIAIDDPPKELLRDFKEALESLGSFSEKK